MWSLEDDDDDDDIDDVRDDDDDQDGYDITINDVHEKNWSQDTFNDKF